MNIVLQQCTAGCEAQPRPHRVKRRFSQPGSRAEITIWNIPVLVCPLCHQSFVEEEVAEQLILFCRPFHGTPGNIPDLPPAKVTIDFEKGTLATSHSAGKSAMIYERRNR